MAKFAKYYIRYKHSFAPYDWENRQDHLAALFEKDDSIAFGEGCPSEEQQLSGIPYARVFNHRVYHLECNPSIIVMQFANSIDIPMEINYEKSIAKNEPSCFVIIDNRNDMRTIAIQNRRKAFSAPNAWPTSCREKSTRFFSPNTATKQKSCQNITPKTCLRHGKNCSATRSPSNSSRRKTFR